MGTVLQYNCDPGYLPIGRSILTCTSLGYWSSEPPRCIHSDGKDKLLILLYAILNPSINMYYNLNMLRFFIILVLDFICTFIC